MNTCLFGGSDESDNDLNLGTNKTYAKSYNKSRQKELIKKFKDRGQDYSDSDSSSESETSDEAEVLDPKFDQEFFKTLASLKSKDPAIYDRNTKFFAGLEAVEETNEEADNEDKAPKEKKSKPVTLKDYERKIILERDGKFEDDSEIEQGYEHDERAASPTVVETERRLKAEFKQAVEADVDSEEEGFGGIFKKRVKSKEETDREEADFVKWLAGKQEDIEDDVKEKLEPLKKYWQSSKLPQSERFLRDYILNKGYAETNVADIPTYDEIVGDTAPLSEDEAELEKQAEFEHKYNFRFEEPDAEFITRYPRTIEHSVRRTDDKRKQKRIEIKERKQQEKEQKMKELEMIREMKRKEIEDKIQKLKMVTGNDELGFKDEELEDDFDPEAHDRRMQEIFNDEYYQVNEGEEKPECPPDIEELKIEDWDSYDPHKDEPSGGYSYEPHCEDDDFIMDCDYDPVAAKEQLQQELIENTKGRKGRKGRKNRFKEMLRATKPAFEADDERTYEEYLDEYYKMDCEDIIGDLPCRFKYVETTPNDFGLSIEEILLAKNKELNQWASLKKAIQIRSDQVEKKEQRLYKMKAKNEELKRKIFKSLYGEGTDDEEAEVTGNPFNTKSKNATAEIKASDIKNLENAAETVTAKSKPKKKRKRKSNATTATSKGNEDSQAISVETATEAPVEKKIKLDEEIITNAEKSTPEVTTSAEVAIVNSNIKKKEKKPKKNNTHLASKSAIVTPANVKPSIDNKQYAAKPLTSNKTIDSSAKVKPITEFNNPAESSVLNASTKTANAKFNAHKKHNVAKPTQKCKNSTHIASGKQNANTFVKQKSMSNVKRGANSLAKQNTNPFKINENKPITNSNKNKSSTLPPLRKSAGAGDAVIADKKFKTKSNKESRSYPQKQSEDIKKNKSNSNQNSNNSSKEGDSKISDERLKAYGINPKKFHKKKKYGANKIN